MESIVSGLEWRLFVLYVVITVQGLVLLAFLVCGMAAAARGVYRVRELEARLTTLEQKMNPPKLVKTVVRVSPTGEITFLDKPETEALKSGGAATKRRASHVEPCRRPYRWAFHGLRKLFGEEGAVGAFTRLWPVYWRVNMGPSGGPVFGRFADRAEAIGAEVEWLNRNGLGTRNPEGPCAP